MEIVIPVLLSLFLGPGVGQLYNKEYKKGAYLIGLSLIVLIACILWFRTAMVPYLPADITTVDPAAVKSLVQNAATETMKAHGKTFYAYELMMLAIWGYSVVDAYRGAQRRRLLLQKK